MARKKNSPKTVTERSTSSAKNIEKKTAKSTARKNTKESVVPVTMSPQMEHTIADVSDNSEDNKTAKILELYQKKKSVLEISKALGLGQGEVKLVIDLYGKN